MSKNVFNTHNTCLRWFLATLQLFKVKYIAKRCEKQQNIKPFWIPFTADFEANFQIICNFLALSPLLRVVWPWFVYWRIPLMSKNVFDTHNTCLRWFLATLQLFKVKKIANYLKFYFKIGSEWDSERFDILLFFAFFGKTLDFEQL